MPTPHIESNPSDIANIVIMPGDPNRASFIAKNFLTDYKLINQVRGMDAYTGYYKNKKVTVFPSGMGIPSMGIYAYELFNNYNVDYIIRIGTIGAYNPNLKLGDVILTKRSYSDSSFAKVQDDYNLNYLDSSSYLNNCIVEAALENNIDMVSGNIFTSDVFYEKKDYKQKVIDYDVLGVEMETFGLLQTARISKKQATSILTVSNSFSYSEELTAEEREKSLVNMIKIALDTSLKL